MGRELYEEMLAGRGELGALAEAARELRAWREGGLAEQEYQDGLYMDGDGMDEASQGDAWSMAAQDRSSRLPSEYRGRGHAVIVARDAGGALYMELVEGGPLMVAGQWLRLGVRVPIDEVPAAISAVDEQASPVELR